MYLLIVESPCEQCEHRGKQTPARYFCNDCQEIYCDTCMNKHRISKYTKEHRIGHIPESALSTITCDTCKYNDITTMASHFCQNCDKYLCGDCSNIHRSSKMSRGHEIQVVSEKIVLCAICSLHGQQSQATCYCFDCENLGLLCVSCVEQHPLMRRTRHHQLLKDISIFTKR